MDLLVNKRLRVAKDVVTMVKRTMNGPGQLNVSVGQEVTPGDSLGRFVQRAGFRRINLAKLLSVSPVQAKKSLQRQVGQKLFQGELLAFVKGGLLSKDKVVTSPSDGTIASFDEKTGELRLQIDIKTIDLAAAVYGIVEKVDKVRKEVTLKTQATEVYGVMGTGKAREGTVNCLGRPGGLVTKNLLNQLMEDTIIVAGGLIYADAIIEAIDFGIHGIITGGINAKDFSKMAGGKIQKTGLGADIGVSLLVTEGFGPLPIGGDIFNILKEYDRHFAIIDGNRGKLTLPSYEGVSMIKVRGAALPKNWNLVEGISDVEAVRLEVGHKVRVIGTDFLGVQGSVVGIDSTVTRLPSGISTFLVTIEAKDRKFKIPYTNLEII